MDTLITRSKYVAETISIVVNFADVLPAGHTIQGAPTVTVSLDTGTDNDPSNILYLGVSIHQGTKVEQRFRLGIPGTIYTITFRVFDGYTYFEKETYLAILPNVGTVSPNYQYLYLTTNLYPLQAQDSISAFFHAQDGTFTIGQTWQQEQFLIGFLPNDGSFEFGQLFTTTLPEELQVDFQPLDGYLTSALVTYTCPPEMFKSDFAPLDGTLTPGQVFYTCPPENINVAFTPLDGTFTT